MSKRIFTLGTIQKLLLERQMLSASHQKLMDECKFINIPTKSCVCQEIEDPQDNAVFSDKKTIEVTMELIDKILMNAECWNYCEELNNDDLCVVIGSIVKISVENGNGSFEETGIIMDIMPGLGLINFGHDVFDTKSLIGKNMVGKKLGESFTVIINNKPSLVTVLGINGLTIDKTIKKTR